MIVDQQSDVYTGTQACIAAALEAGARAYYAAPSPMQAALLNEGARRFPQAHGNFVQAADPVEALSMALGAAYTGILPLVSASYSDFLAMQEVLAHFHQQHKPCILALMLYDPPRTPNDASLSYAYPCFMEPWPSSGFPLLSLMPSSLPQLYQLMQDACQLAETLSQPVALLLDPALMSVTAAVQPGWMNKVPAIELSTHPHWAERKEQNYAQVRKHASRWLRRWEHRDKPEHYLLATGALGGWLLDMEWDTSEWAGGVLVPESLAPLALPPKLISALEHSQHRVYVAEFEPSALSRRLRQKYPRINWQALPLSWSRQAPVGLYTQVCEALSACP